MIDEQPPNVGILERMRASSSTLSPAERRVADSVLAEPFSVMHLSVTELAVQAGSSPASVVRMCTSLGLRGFQELKILLARESVSTERPPLDSIEADDGAVELVRKVLGSTRQALERTESALVPAVIEDAADRMLRARRVQFGGVGTSAPLAADIAYRMMTIGVNASFLADVHSQHVAARMLGAEDIFFAISHTGSTFETLAAARAAGTAGATVIAMTSFVSSPLTELADLVIVAGSAETAYRVEAMASRIVHLTVLDVIYSILALRAPSASAAQALTADVLIEHRF